MGYLEHFEDVLSADLFGIGSVGAAFGAEKNISPHGKVGKQGAFLGNVTDTSVLWWQVNSSGRRKELSAVNLDLACHDVT
jgi:hypothetical protein